MIIFLLFLWLGTGVVLGILFWAEHRDAKVARAVLAAYELDLARKNEEAKRRAEEYFAQRVKEAQGIINNAQAEAYRAGAEANRARIDADMFGRTASAMKNAIEGYGERYLVPGTSLLDELAEDFGHEQAGKELKSARHRVKTLVAAKKATVSDYQEAGRKEVVESLVIDAFNAKVESILADTKATNYGQLAQQIRDAEAMAAYHGLSLNNARITPEYLDARLNELKWAVTVLELRKKQQEEQRQLREQAREEEKARRDYERALKETEREEQSLRRAMAKAQEAIAAATNEQKAKYELQLADLQARLVEAEEKNKRALSMAQQTKRGFVYIISNVGSFGENVYKIGLTRRLDPQDRIDELGDASVPFEFDVHALILSEDAPELEHRLHKHFLLNQVNKVNFRKEFFRTDLSKIRTELESLGISASWTMAARAEEYRETLAIERMIANDPAARERWMNRQLVINDAELAREESSAPGSPAGVEASTARV